MKLGLTRKMFMVMFLAIALVVGAMVLASHWILHEGLGDYIVRVDQQTTERIAKSLGEEYSRQGDWWFLRERPWLLHDIVVSTMRGAASQLNQHVGILPRLYIMDANGELVARGAPPGHRDPPNPPRMFITPITVKGEKVGEIHLLPVPIDVGGLDEVYREEQQRAFLVVAAIAFFLVLSVALPMASHLIQPIRRVASGLHQLASGDYTLRLPEGRSDELGGLSRDLNYLAEVLQRSEAQRREGMANVSHELRTPLATLRAEIEAMQDGIRALDTEQLEGLNISVRHMSRLVDDLYQLAKADNGNLLYHREVVDWSEIVEDAVDAARPRLAAKGLSLETDFEQSVSVFADADRLRQQVDNLLENCRRYTEPNGRIMLSLKQQGEQGLLRVADSGPGVPPEALGTLFDRFYRVESSRNRNFGGSGLGLAMVKAIAQAHQGDATAALVPQGGLAISISLPIYERSKA